MVQLHQSAELELFQHRFAAIASEMGDILVRTALSTNVKERLDFSCALLDAEGRLVVNAPHIPVHLGALGLCVRRVAATMPPRPGDSIVTNHPHFGGSHLPDVTLMTPVFDDRETLLGWVASRAHHSEIGGKRPGSMPADARNLAEEGVVLPPTRVLERGVAQWHRIEELLSGGRWPSRSIDENLADLRAAQAASHRGTTALRELSRNFGGKPTLYMEKLRQQAAGRMMAALEQLGDVTFRATETLDDGATIAVEITIESGRATIDFTGTSPQQEGNLNAPEAVVRSAVLYVLRLLIDQEMPLNEGLMAPVSIVVPPGTLLSPVFVADPALCPAVVGGNVETSQRIVGTLLKALGLVAGSQGTMNNTIFGNERFGYYETVCGGSGAGPGFDGESAVHCHMTNTRITDPELLEHRYPVRLEEFRIRKGSGGGGRYRGGNGVIRKLLFLEPVTLSMLTQHRSRGPYGLAGGEDGSSGRQRLVRVSGQVEELPASVSVEVNAGDELILETPGGGGYGEA